MNSTDPATAFVELELGTAASFDPNIFPLAYYEECGDNLTKGSFLIKATLKEVEDIKNLGIDLNNTIDFIFNTRLKVQDLREQRAKLQDNHKTLNPFKAIRNYKAARLFHAASRAVYIQTKRTSERIHRTEKRLVDDKTKRTSEETHREEKCTRVVPSAQMRAVNDAVSPDVVIAGLAIDLPDGWNDDVKRTINDVTEMMANAGPFEDNFLISQLRDGEQAITLADTASLLSQDVCDSGVDEGNRTPVSSSNLQLSRPTSPKTITVNFITNSNLSGCTFNNHGNRNSGASVTQEFAP